MTATVPERPALNPFRPERLQVFVPGHPRPQGSKSYKGKRRNGSAILVESSQFLKGWRDSIVVLLRERGGRTWPKDAAVVVTLEFVMPRPVNLSKFDSRPMVARPDLDKLTRAVFDALTEAGILADDSQVVELRAVKRRASVTETPGVQINVRTY